MNISAVIIAFNEEASISDALASVDWADEVLVVDSGSSDMTRDIAEKAGARVIEQEWLGFALQKQFAADNARNDLVLSLDADERVSEGLRNEIIALVHKGDPKDGYMIPRQSFYLGQRIRHGGWYPDRQLRLFDRRKGHWKDRVIHESFVMDPGTEIGTLSQDLLHFSVENPEHHNRMIAERYAPLGALQMEQDGQRTSFVKALISSWATFVRTYLLKLGFLDGKAGFMIAYFAAHNTFLKHLIALDRNREK